MNSLKEQYDLISEAFSESRKKQLWPELLSYLARLEPGARVLDMGSGSGRLYNGILPGVLYVGVDNSPGMLKEARKNHPQATFIEADILDGESLNYLGDFDFVFIVAVMHHFNERELRQLLVSAQRRINKNGVIIVSSWRLETRKYFLLHLKQLLTKIKKRSWRYVEVPFSFSNGTKATKTIKRSCYAYGPAIVRSAARSAGLSVRHYKKSPANLWFELTLSE